LIKKPLFGLKSYSKSINRSESVDYELTDSLHIDVFDMRLFWSELRWRSVG